MLQMYGLSWPHVSRPFTTHYFNIASFFSILPPFFFCNNPTANGANQRALLCILRYYYRYAAILQITIPSVNYECLALISFSCEVIVKSLLIILSTIDIDRIYLPMVIWLKDRTI